MTLIRTAIAAEFNTARLIEFSEQGVQIYRVGGGH